MVVHPICTPQIQGDPVFNPRLGLTNGFSKKIHNHYCATMLHFMFYNFARIHQTLRVTPAMEAGVSNHVWSIEEIVGLLEQRENEQSEQRAALKSN